MTIQQFLKELSKVLSLVKFIYLAVQIVETVWTNKLTTKIGRPTISSFLYVKVFAEFILTIFSWV